MTTDGLRLALGTFTVLPVPPPRQVGPREARTAILVAPLVRALLGAAAGLAAWAAAQRAGAAVGAVVALGLLAVATRALHLDGLADTADALGSGRSGPQALEVMRRSDIGPFGVVTLVLVLALDAACVAALLEVGGGLRTAVVGLAAATAAGGVGLCWACRRGVPAARPDGLGAAVAGSVPGAAAAAITAAVAVAVWAGGMPAAAAGVLVGALVSVLLTARAVGRWGGITGDVLGAVVEAATAAALLTTVLATCAR